MVRFGSVTVSIPSQEYDKSVDLLGYESLLLSGWSLDLKIPSASIMAQVSDYGDILRCSTTRLDVVTLPKSMPDSIYCVLYFMTGFAAS